MSRAKRVTIYYAVQFLMMGYGKTELMRVLDFVSIDNEWGTSDAPGGHRRTVTLTRYCLVPILWDMM
jgi:hypothetical protein